ncbi:MAG: hypothetical protein ACR2MD_13455 [Aridibacter sp.]
MQIYPARICKQLLDDLHLGDYIFHRVDFQGASNFGAFCCWLALYPQNKSSHRDAHQFFVKFNPEIEVGRFSRRGRPILLWKMTNRKLSLTLNFIKKL